MLRKTKTLYLGNSAAAFNQIRSLLELHQIPYKIRLSDRNSWLGSHGTARSFGSGGQASSFVFYEILVKEKDFENMQGAS